MPFLVAVQFLTILPLGKSKPSAAELGAALAFFPLVGLLLGLALAGLDIAFGRFWPPPLGNALLVVFLIAATGALHLEGFLDACDGLFGGHSREQRLAIMRDGRVGAFAVAGGVCLVLVKWAALSASGGLGEPARFSVLVVFPILSRWSMVLAIAAFPYAREQGLGAAFRQGATWPRIALAAALALVGAIAFAGLAGVAIFVVASAVALLIGGFAAGRLGGLTGDVYGAICELTEVVLLLIAASPAGVGLAGPLAAMRGF